MIFGAHAVIFSKAPQDARALLKTVLGTRSIDAGAGWLILALPPAEIAVHPTDGAPEHQGGKTGARKRKVARKS